MSDSLFHNKNTLIFGGGKGIGRAIALEFAARGSKVAISDIDKAAAEQGAQTIINSGGKSIHLYCDVTDSDSVRATAEAAEQALGDIDIVVNNVGVILSGNPEDIPFEEWQRIVNLNLYPVVRSNEIFLPKMLARGRGHIVNTASVAGLFPYDSGRLPYVATKAAIIAMTEGLALYAKPKGVNVSVFCPGPTMTGVSDNIKTWSENVPMRGPGKEFDLMTAEQAAIALANGMERGLILIPAHEVAFEIMREHAASPDQYIQKKIDDFERGEFGLPVFNQ